MRSRTGSFRKVAKWIAVGTSLMAGAYVAYVATTWARYGRIRPAADDEQDPLMDRFMPVYDVVDRHHIRVNAPAALTLAIARDMDLFELPLVRAIFKGRELILGADADDRPRPSGLVAQTQSLGWGMLADVADREIVVGAVTKPWEANVTFRTVGADEFAAFAEPDYVKIAWTLRADPADDGTTVFRTETRVMPTDAAARAKFRRYWPFFSPGIKLIRLVAVREVRRRAARASRDRSMVASSRPASS